MKLINSDCIEAMRSMPDNSVDSIVTDPPYELGFMGKSWDSTGIANSVEMWSEALRVLKPGGYLIAFSGSRTYHRMAVAIEDAGFDIRDQIMWVYGSGFPKSHNISKTLDKMAGVQPTVIGSRPLIGNGKTMKSGFHQPDGTGAGETIKEDVFEITIATSEQGKQWQGWGTALKPAHEPIVLARKPLIGTVANNVLTHGTGGLNIDGCRVGSEVRKNNVNDFSNQSGNQFGNGQPIAKLGESEVTGRFPANFIHDGSDEVLALFPETKSGAMNGVYSNTMMTNNPGKRDGKPIHLIQEASSGSAARFFYCAKASKKDRNEGLDGFESKQTTGGGGGIGDYLDDVNSASGKFGSEKAPSANTHPTVKPTDLMRYLCRLITPPNGTVLDPFMGSGSTGKAAILEGFNFIGIDMTPEYVEIARARIEFAIKNKDEDEQGTLF